MLESPIFTSEKGLKVWMWCLLRASWKDREVYFGRSLSKLKAGQFIFGRSSAAEELNLPASTIWSWMKILESDSFIDIKSTTKFSLISVKNWDKYQVDDSEVDNKRKTNEKQTDTNKNSKNSNNKAKALGSKQNYGNPLVSFVLETFKNHFNHYPTDKYPERVAWNLIQRITTITKKRIGGEITDERIKKAVAVFFNWLMTQNGVDKIEKLETAKLKLNIFQETLPDRKEKNA